MEITFLLAFFMPLLCNSKALDWSLSKSLNSSNFFDGSYWNFITAADPTHGYVNYVDKSTAQSDGYISSNGSTVYIGCDHSNVANSGRNSVRLESKTRYNSGLFILYLKHMPTGCGTWPAWWTYGPNWPNSGEIDVILGVDVNTHDLSELHTGAGCNMSSAAKNYSGSSNGNYSCVGPDGCGIFSSNANSFGAAFNSKGGGLYAMQWTSDGIKTWMWNEGNIPSNAQSNDPNPDSWGVPYAAFPFGSWCTSSHFANHVVVFDLTFCGDWDGRVFATDCPGKGSCTSYVANNPSAFTEAYWNINFMKVFQ